MKTLWLIRHAKSSWKHPNLADPLRPLNARGYRQGPALAAQLPNCGLRWACSPAVRAYSTCRLLTLELPQLIPALYPGDPETVRRWLGEQDPAWPELALVGHNPGMAFLASWLTGEPAPLKTAQAVAISLRIENWRQVAPENVEGYRRLSSGQ